MTTRKAPPDGRTSSWLARMAQALVPRHVPPPSGALPGDDDILDLAGWELTPEDRPLILHDYALMQLQHTGDLNMPTANDLQVGGAHYRDADPQPWDVIQSWGLGFLDGNALKYLARWNKKGDPLGDLRKAQHYLSKLIEVEEARQRQKAETAERQDLQQIAAKFAASEPAPRPAPPTAAPAPPAPPNVSEMDAQSAQTRRRKS